MIETMAHGNSSESTQQELSNKYQHDRVEMVFKDLCILVLWTIIRTLSIGKVKSHNIVIPDAQMHRNTQRAMRFVYQRLHSAKTVRSGEVILVYV